MIGLRLNALFRLSPRRRRGGGARPDLGNLKLVQSTAQGDRGWIFPPLCETLPLHQKNKRSYTAVCLMELTNLDTLHQMGQNWPSRVNNQINHIFTLLQGLSLAVRRAMERQIPLGSWSNKRGPPPERERGDGRTIDGWRFPKTGSKVTLAPSVRLIGRRRRKNGN